MTELAANLGRIVKRMESITKQLRFFASPGGRNLERFDLKDAVKGALSLVRHDLDASMIPLDLHLPDAACMIRGNRFRIEQGLVNLLSNSIAPMQDATNRRLAIELLVSARNAELSVADTGHGLNGALINDLSEPFHSTRSSGEGMGLGLAISTAIVREHGGDLIAEDRGNDGAIFTVRVPLLFPEQQP